MARKSLVLDLSMPKDQQETVVNFTAEQEEARDATEAKAIIDSAANKVILDLRAAAVLRLQAKGATAIASDSGDDLADSLVAQGIIDDNR